MPGSWSAARTAELLDATADSGLPPPPPPREELLDELKPYAVEARIGFPIASRDRFLLPERRTRPQRTNNES